MILSKNVTVFAALTALAMVFVSPVQAQDINALNRLGEINRIKPLQNKRFQRSDKILHRSVQDRKSKIIGNVQDITINPNGSIESITTDFNRLRLGNDVALNFREMQIRTLSNSYALNLNAKEVKDVYPQLLANIDTASGDGASSLSVRRIVGSQLYSVDGRRLGKIQQVLFGANGARVDAIFVELSYRKNRGNTAAIPMRSVKFSEKNGRLRAVIENSLVKPLFKVASRSGY